MKPTAAPATFPYAHRTMAEVMRDERATRPDARIQWEVVTPCGCSACKREKAA